MTRRRQDPRHTALGILDGLLHPATVEYVKSHAGGPGSVREWLDIALERDRRSRVADPYHDGDEALRRLGDELHPKVAQHIKDTDPSEPGDDATTWTTLQWIRYCLRVQADCDAWVAKEIERRRRGDNVIYLATRRTRPRS